jgi:choline dehydrogenase-like flavoprotein
MLIDARSLPNNEQLSVDVCIVGAGAAGIAVARELAGAQFTVILLEGGGLKFEHRSQFLHRGKSRGRSYPPPENTRRRQFGGTTAAWFGRCRPLDAIDFEARPSLPNSGWPFGKSELDKYSARAADLCQIEGGGFEMAEDPLAPTGLESKLFQFSPPTHFGQAYLKDLQAASNMRVVLHANAAEIELDESGTRTTNIRCLTLNRRRAAGYRPHLRDWWAGAPRTRAAVELKEGARQWDRELGRPRRALFHGAHLQLHRRRGLHAVRIP